MVSKFGTFISWAFSEWRGGTCGSESVNVRRNHKAYYGRGEGAGGGGGGGAEGGYIPMSTLSPPE